MFAWLGVQFLLDVISFSVIFSKSLVMNFKPKFLWTPDGLHVDSRWTPGGLQVHLWLKVKKCDIWWSPGGIIESIWSPPGVYGGG